MAKEPYPKAAHMVSIEFKPAENGAISDTHIKRPRGPKGGGPAFDFAKITTVPPSMKHAMAHLKKHLAPAFGESEEPQVESETNDEEQ